MSTPLVEQFSDEEREAIDYLTSRVPDLPTDLQDATVGLILPPDWTRSSPPHLGVRSDYCHEAHAWQRPGALYRNSTIRVTAWAATPSLAKRLARLAHAAMLAWPTRPNTGVMLAEDPDNRAPMAFFTVRRTDAPL